MTWRKERPLGEPAEHDDDEEVCGWSYDHRLELVAESVDGGRTYVCRECGCEIQEFDDEVEADRG